MKLLPIALLFLQAASVVTAPTPERRYFHYERKIAVMEPGQTCALLDATAYSHAAPSLKDLRIYPADVQGARDIPFAITLSFPAQPDSEPAGILNLGQRGRNIVFDLAMPPRPYTDVTLNLDGHDFLATATVSASNDPNEVGATKLGQFTLFDLTSQHLSRSTRLRLQESSFPYLHVELAVSPASASQPFVATPQMVKGATVPPSREAQTLFTLAAETNAITQQGRQSVARLLLPERVPVERTTFELTPVFKGNFSRDVLISDKPEGMPDSASETISGTIMRVHLTQAGREIRQEDLSIPGTLGSNLQGPASVMVMVNNGDDAPLPIATVKLEMRERRLCFDATAAGNYTVYYGDADLPAPEYDYARTFSTSAQTHLVQLGPEQQNPSFVSRPDIRPLTERHPDLIWIAFLIVICVLALVALRSSKNLHHHR